MPALPFAPPLHATKQWQLLTGFHVQKSLKPAGRYAMAVDRQLHRLPWSDLWLAAWHGQLSIHWAFWCLFVAPLLALSMMAVHFDGVGLLIMDVVSAFWMAFSFLLVWRSGAGHMGWGAAPVLYRVVMVAFLLPLSLMVAVAALSAVL